MSLKQVTTVAAPANSRIFVAQIGGPVAAVVPATPTILTGGAKQNFIADRNGRFFYFIDSSGNILSWDANNPATLPSTFVSQATIGATPLFMDISLDNTTIYFTASDYRVYQLVISTKVVSVLAGSGTNAHTNGTGTGASFAAPTGIAVEPNNGLYLYVWNVTTGSVDKIVIATGVVTTVRDSIQAAQVNQIFMGKDGNIFFITFADIIKLNPISAVKFTWTPVSGHYVNGISVDDDEPGPSCLYLASSTDNTMIKRTKISTSNWEQVATLSSAYIATSQSGFSASMCYRHPALYIVDYLGNLVKIAN